MHKYLRKQLFFAAIIGLAVFYGLSTYSRNLEWRDPVIFYQHIIRNSPDSFSAHNNLGVEYQRRGQLDLAIGEFKKALQIKPQRIEPHSNLASIYTDMGNFSKAEEEYKIVEKITPPFKAGELQNNIAALYEKEGRPDLALERYQLALRLDPALSFVHFNLARIYLEKQELAKAANQIAKSLSEKENPACIKIIEESLAAKQKLSCAVTYYNGLGTSLAAAGFPDEAIAAFQKVTELSPAYADAHFNLGLAYWKKGLKKQAILQLKQALKINPGHSKAGRLLQEIRR